MDSYYEVKYHQQEKKHYWFKARRHAIFSILKRLRVDKHSKILDLGCSGGELLLTLKKEGYGDIYGVDISSRAIGLCKEKGLQNVFVMNAEKLNFTDTEFDAIIASDVLEHIEDEDSALAEWNRLLKPDGKLVLFVPAFNFIWSAHDQVNHHYRRYSKATLTELLEGNKFKQDKCSYWGFSLFFPAVLMIIFGRLFLKNNDKNLDRLGELSPLLNGFITNLLKLENCLLNWINFPVGTSLFAVVGKKE